MAVSCLAIAAVAVAAAETLADRSLEKLTQNPLRCAETVDFVVCADPQPASLLGTPKVFFDMIREWNILRPDLVICAGDMIMGGPPAEVGVMWDEFLGAVEGLEPPFFPVAGNHDVNDDPEVLQIYQDRVGPFNYTITRGNVLFVVLNTEEPGDPDGLSGQQRDWLVETLDASAAEHIFLFLHVPLFRGNWERDWQPTADILKRYPVRAVFAGHEHLYRDCGILDGVRYVVAGSAGGGIGTPEEEGGFFCYLWVTVRGDEVSWAVVRPGAVLPADIVTEEAVEQLRSLRGMLAMETVELPWGEPFDREVSATLANPFPWHVQTRLEWETAPGWKADPGQLAFSVPPGEAVSLTTRLKHAGPAFFPAPALQGVVESTETGEPLSLGRRLELLPTIQAPFASAGVTLDGDLTEWSASPVLPLLYGVGYDPADTEDLGATTRLMWDESHLYVAIEVEDNEFHQPYHGDIVWMADSVELWIEDSNWSFSLTPGGPQVFLDERPDKHLDAVVDTVPLAVARRGNRVIYEAAFPADELPQIHLGAGTALHFSLLVNDLDPSGPNEKRHYAELTPGAGAHFDCAKFRVFLAEK